jgi:hypothetical protein
MLSFSIALDYKLQPFARKKKVKEHGGDFLISQTPVATTNKLLIPTIKNI